MLGGVYICNKTRLMWRIKLRIPVVNKSMRLHGQAAMSVHVRQLREKEELLMKFVQINIKVITASIYRDYRSDERVMLES